MKSFRLRFDVNKRLLGLPGEQRIVPSEVNFDLDGTLGHLRNREEE